MIIPTSATAARARSLRRAIASIRASSSDAVEIIVVANGGNADPALCAWLRAQPDIRYDYLPAPSAPAAVLRGRELLARPFFACLDDDDEYLPGGIDLRRAALAAAPHAALVVSDGHLREAHGDEVAIPHLARVAADPMAALFEGAWLNSCNALFRASAFGADFFAEPHPYVEWTWLAFKIAARGLRVATLATPTFRVNNSAQSLSKSDGYVLAYVDLYQRMIDAAPQPRLRPVLRRRLGAAWHQISVVALEQQRVADAWRPHLESLRQPGGLQYIAYTRHIVAAALKRRSPEPHPREPHPRDPHTP